MSLSLSFQARHPGFPFSGFFASPPLNRRLAVGLLQILELPLVLFAGVEGVRALEILHAAFGASTQPSISEGVRSN